MKNRIMKVAQMLCLLVLAGFGTSAHAILIEFTETNEDLSGSTYTVDGFVFTGVKINPGGCADGGPDPCINLTAGKTFMLTHTSLGAFTLNSFWFDYAGETSLLTVQAFDQDATKSFSQTMYPMKGGPYTVENGTDFVFDDDSKYTFSAANGNIRLDDFSLTYGNGGTVVPEPGTLGLLGLGLLGLAINRRRKV